MLSFKQFLIERIINLGFKNPGDRHPYSSEIHKIIRDAYKPINGYMGLGHRTKAEREAIHSDIHNDSHAIKLYRHGGKIRTAVIYKKDENGNRKIIAAGTDGSEHGKDGLVNHILKDDHHMHRAWVEASGALHHVMKKIGFEEIPPDKVQRVTKKHIEPLPDGGYVRMIGGHPHVKHALGTIKEKP